MLCHEIENKILDYQEKQLPADQQAEVHSHLAGCPVCRTFAGQLERLDKALSAGVKIPALSASFERRLHEQIQTGSVTLSAAQLAERKRLLQAEFDAGLARVSRGTLALGGLLTHLAWLVLGLVAASLAWRFIPQVHWDGLDPHLLSWLAASAVFLVIGMAEVFPRRWQAET